MDALLFVFFLFPTSGILAPSSSNSLWQFKVKRKISWRERGEEESLPDGGEEPTSQLCSMSSTAKLIIFKYHWIQEFTTIIWNTKPRRDAEDSSFFITLWNIQSEKWRHCPHPILVFGFPINHCITNPVLPAPTLFFVRHGTALPHQLWETSLVTYLGCVRSMRVADRREHGWGWQRTSGKTWVRLRRRKLEGFPGP